jgi:uncharacterized SAM-binding protein YcdF (DUF218 family)
METLIVLVMISIAWIVSSRRWRRWLVTPIAVLAVVYLILTSSPFVVLVNRGLMAMLPPDSGATVDAIVVLGRGAEMRQGRVEVAAELWQKKRSPKIFASGMSDAQQIIDGLKQQGVSGQDLSGESCSQSTQENALFTAAVLLPQGIQTIVLITDAPHLPRSFFLFRDAGFTILPHSSPLPAFWNSRRNAQVVLRETAGLLLYQMQNGLQPQSDRQPQKLSPEMFNRLTEWGCQLQG